jgi:hypothetical protein
MAKTKTTKVAKKVTVAEQDVAVEKAIKVSTKYHIEIKVNDVVFDHSAESIKQALFDFVASPVYPFGAKTKMFIKYSKGKIERHRLFHTQEARRVILTMRSKPIAVEILAAKLTRDLE